MRSATFILFACLCICSSTSFIRKNLEESSIVLQVSSYEEFIAITQSSPKSVTMIGIPDYSVRMIEYLNTMGPFYEGIELLFVNSDEQVQILYNHSIETTPVYLLTLNNNTTKLEGDINEETLNEQISFIFDIDNSNIQHTDNQP